MSFSLAITAETVGTSFTVVYSPTSNSLGIANAPTWEHAPAPLAVFEIPNGYSVQVVPPPIKAGPDSGAPVTDFPGSLPLYQQLTQLGAHLVHPGLVGYWSPAPFLASFEGNLEYHSDYSDLIPPSHHKEISDEYHGTHHYKARYLKTTTDPITEADVIAAFERRYPGESYETQGDFTNGFVVFNRDTRHLVHVRGSRYIAKSREEGGWEIDEQGRILVWNYGGQQGRERLESRMSERPSAANTAVIRKAVDAMMNRGRTLAELIEADRRTVDTKVQEALARIDEDDVRARQQAAVENARFKLVGTDTALDPEDEEKIRNAVRASIEADITYRVLVETQALRVLSGGLEVAMETELLAIMNDRSGEQAAISQDELNQGTWEKSTDRASGPLDVLTRLAGVIRESEADVAEALANSEALAGRSHERRTAGVVSLSNDWAGTHRGTRVNILSTAPKGEYVAALIGAWGSGGWIDRFSPVGMAAEVYRMQALREGFSDVAALINGIDPGAAWDVQSAQINLGWALYFNPDTGRYEVNERIGDGFKSFMSSIFGAVFKMAAMSGGYTKGFYPEVTDPRTGEKLRPAGYREVVHNGMGTAGWQTKPGSEAAEFENLIVTLTNGSVDRIARAEFYERRKDGTLQAIMHNVARGRTEEVNIDAPHFRSEPSARGEITSPGNALQWSKGALTALSQILGFMFHEFALRPEGTDFYNYMDELIVAGGGESMSHDDMYGQPGERQENIVDDYNLHGNGSEMSLAMLRRFSQLLDGLTARNIPALRELLPIARGLVDALQEESVSLEEYAKTARGNLGRAVLHDLYERRGLNGRQALEVYKAMHEAELQFIEGRDLTVLAELNADQMKILLEGNGEIAASGLQIYQPFLVNLSDAERAALLDGSARKELPTLLAQRKQDWLERKRGYYFNPDDVEIPAEYADGVA